jgi:sigma-B regulation protein RsbU (phosphoserine phosphatase)
MRLKKRTLIQTLSASVALTLLLSAVFLLSVGGIRNTVLRNSGELGSIAAAVSSQALEEQIAGTIARIAQDGAVILEEKLLKIENHTRMTADIAGSIFTRKEIWGPKRLPRVAAGETAPQEPYIHVMPGLDYKTVQGEAELAGNIVETLRQIVVVDRGIASTNIGGEAGYIISMDTVPWSTVDFDPRTQPWYQGARAREGLFWTGVYGDLRGRGPILSCAMPFYDRSGGGRVFKGAAMSVVLLPELSRLAGDAGVGREGYLFVVDRAGLLLFSGGEPRVQLREGVVEGENFLESPEPAIRDLARRMTGGEQGLTKIVLGGTPVYAAYAPVRPLGWSLGVAIPVDEIRAPAFRIGEDIRDLTEDTRRAIDRHILLLAALVAFLLLAVLGGAAVLSVKFTAALTGPILALNRGVQDLSGGNLQGEVRVSTGDELEELAASFNAMTGRLRELVAETTRATAEKERIATELDVATRIQASMLPGGFPPFPDRPDDFELFAVVHPAREVGGDFYDFFFIDGDHLAVLAADVSGKGVPAALFMAIAKALIKSRLQAGEEMGAALENINRQLGDHNTEGMFVTLWLGTLELSTGVLRFINAGHPPPLLKTGGTGFVFLSSPPDLFLAGAADTVYHRRERLLGPGDTLFLYTDGVTEAANRAGDFYGAARLRAFLDRWGELPARDLLARLRGELEDFSRDAGQSDDITLLVLRITGGGRGETGSRRLTLEADTERLGELMEFIGEELAGAGCPERIRGQIELAAEEIFVNIARYAYGPPPEAVPPGSLPPQRTVTVECGIRREAGRTGMFLSFSDQGRPFNPLGQAEPDLNLPPEERPVGGLGVLIVKRTMDTMEYHQSGGVNRLELGKSW